MERLCTAILLASATAACSVTPANIEQWKTTQKGPDKLAAVLLDDKYTPEIRGRAAIALAEVNSPSSSMPACIERSVARRSLSPAL